MVAVMRLLWCFCVEERNLSWSILLTSRCINRHTPHTRAIECVEASRGAVVRPQAVSCTATLCVQLCLSKGSLSASTQRANDNALRGLDIHWY